MSTEDDNDNNNTPPPEDQAAPPPPPIESGVEQEQTFSFDEAALESPEENALNRRGSSLGGNSSKAITFGALLLLGTGIILYYLFSDTAPPPQAPAGGVVPTKPSGELIAQPATAPPAATGISAPAAPSAPPAPPPPPPPPPPPAPPAVVKAKNAPPPKPQAPLAPPDIRAIAPAADAKAAVDKRSTARMRSNMMLMSDGKTADTTNKKNAKAAIDQNDPNAAFTSNVIAASDAETTVATKLTNLNTVIAQGKIVNAVLETAINTDLPGTLRAIISRDVYAEAGRAVLIPKGSRLIGTYNTGIMRGQKRVLIVWTRVITPSGIDIMIDSPAVDSLGKAGVAGMVDNKFMESFSAAILTSMISIGVAIAADRNMDSNNTTTTQNTDGSSTSTGSAGGAAATGAVQALGDVGSEIVGSMLDLRPTISIDQGTRISVFVNQDLVVPSQPSSGSMFVQ